MSDRSSTTFGLIPGAGGSATYWYRLVEELRQRGREAVAVDLPAADDSAGLAEYTDAVVTAIGDRSRIVLVARSMGGFTAPLVCERVQIELLVLLNAMAPAPEESPGEWWENTGQPAAAAAYAASEGRPSGGCVRPARRVLPRRPRRGEDGHVRRARAGTVGHPVREAVAAREVAGRSDQVPAGP
jgi:alpha-beta hydrolase superfamily lysophospholipase